jgi:hypothetical protein
MQFTKSEQSVPIQHCICWPVSFVALSVHAKSIRVSEIAVAESPVGALGAPDMGVGVIVGVGVAVGAGVLVGVAVGGTGVFVGTGVAVGVAVGEAGVGVGVGAVRVAVFDQAEDRV